MKFLNKILANLKINFILERQVSLLFIMLKMRKFPHQLRIRFNVESFFLYKNVLKKELDYIIAIYWSKRPKKLPVVFAKNEAIEVLDKLKGAHWLVGMLLYGFGSRLFESLEQ